MFALSGNTARYRSRRSRLVGIALATALFLAACSGSGSGQDGQSAKSGDLIKVDVGYIPIVTAVMPVQFAIREGYFKDEGLEVTAHTAQGGAALVPALVSGQYQFVFANDFSVIAAAAKGLDLRIMSSANNSGTDPQPIEEALVARQDINSLSDLEGKTVAVNTLNNIVHLANLVALDKAGVNSSKVKFIEVPFPDMPQALMQGRVAAIDIAEPFKTKVLQNEGVHVIAKPFRALDDNLVVSSWVTSGSYLSNNSDIVNRFSRALNKGKAYGNAHPGELRSLAAKTLKIDPQIADKMVVTEMTTGQPPASQLQLIADDAIRFGFIDKAPDVKKILDVTTD